MSDPVSIWLDAAEMLLDDAKQNLDPGEWLQLADAVRRRLAVTARQRPELVIRIPVEGGVRFYAYADPSEFERLQHWISAHAEYGELIDVARRLQMDGFGRRSA